MECHDGIVNVPGAAGASIHSCWKLKQITERSVLVAGCWGLERVVGALRLRLTFSSLSSIVSLPRPHPSARDMEGNAFYSYAQLVVGLVGHAPTTLCLQHTHRLLTRSFPDTALQTKLVLEAWAAVNDVIFRHEGFLPYEVFEEMSSKYGAEIARLVVSFDNLFISGSGQQGQGAFKARTQPLCVSVQLMTRALTDDRSQEDDSLGRLLKWFNDRAASGTGPQQDFNDIDILTWWAQLVTRGAIMEDSGSLPKALNATFGSKFTTPKPAPQRSPRLQQQQALLQAAAQQWQAQSPLVPVPAPLLQALLAKKAGLTSSSAMPPPSPLQCQEQLPLQLVPSDSDVMQVDEPMATPMRSTPSPASPSPVPSEASGGGGGRSSPGSSAYGLSPGVTMLYELWLSREQKLQPSRVAALLGSIKARLDVIWATADQEVLKVARSQTPKLLRELLETQGIKRVNSFVPLDESWDLFLRFLDIKTQPLLTKGLRTTLSSTGGKALAGRVGVVEQLLPELAMRPRKPLATVDELVSYVQVHQQELQALVELLHRGSGMYKQSLEQLQLWIAQHQKEARTLGSSSRTQGPQ